MDYEVYIECKHTHSSWPLASLIAPHIYFPSDLYRDDDEYGKRNNMNLKGIQKNMNTIHSPVYAHTHTHRVRKIVE